ncbi:caleosin domain-containing protein [Tothia fuscella]|uniref:Caleosin domain-containing protein n=1 Tax=Tothia fuscella TaxID=1048955 RepID=A0A9P4NFR7_9PEZI|nr:caleosin domain-containing protein [Tothia fuscella]
MDGVKDRQVHGDSDEEQITAEIVTSIEAIPVTYQVKPFVTNQSKSLPNAGIPRANIAPSVNSPNGTTKDNWAKNHSQQTVLQQHCEFFDLDRDGIVWPSDTFRGFHNLGFGIFLSLLAVGIIHANFAYPTQKSWFPDPTLRIHLERIHHDKHGSDSNTYDHQGRFVPQHFEDIFAKYAEGRDYLTFWDLVKLWNGQRCIADPIGWGGALFEWLATYLLLWPADGKMYKEDIRAIYDGSIFHGIASKRSKRKIK